MPRTKRAEPPAKPAETVTQMTVCIVDNDAETLKSLRFLLDRKRIPVETFASADEFLKNWRPERTGCVVVDIRMPGMTGSDLQLELRKRNQNVPVILMTGYGDVPLAVEAMSRGALHFFEKPIPYQDLLLAIEKGLRLNADARILDAELREFELRYARLSPKERVVADHVAEGKMSHEIAEELKIVVGTVDLHRSRIYEKLEVRNVAELVRMLVTKRVVLNSSTGPIPSE